ncbi:MAG: helix-turn-helix transcriptional regulator [Bacteroidales bacterium]|nr:helix-turn-helix transcriptional regulator [Bacteroidales bacterium]MBD5344713.1 helix-turn-helix transcriptional regulator [Bacteroides sp.]
MKRSSIIEARRAKVSPEVRRSISLSFLIVDRIHAILEERGLKQKDLANMLGKKESEISKWMRGTHNFTIDTISSIENVLGYPILQVAETHS